MRSKATSEMTYIGGDTARRVHRRRKRILFALVTCLLLCLVIDGMFYFFLSQLHQQKHIFYQVQIPTDVELDGFCQKYFDAELGWDIPVAERGAMGERAGSRYSIDAPFTLKVFGDSFAYGDGVQDDETFSAFIEQTAGWSCLNYGVPAYGPDQALLKYKRNSVKSDYVILSILDENIGRCVTVWWNFYLTGGPLGTKPRFVIEEESFNLVANPISNCDDLKKLKERQYIEQLRTDDYWTGYYRQINAPPTLTWPASLTILPHLNFFVRNFGTTVQNRIGPTYDSMLSARKFTHLYEKDSEGIKVLCQIVDEFIRTARSKNEIPIVVIFPLRDTVDVIKAFDRKPYQSLVDHIANQNSDFIDFGDVFASESYELYYQGGYGHFTRSGNKKVAEEIVTYIQRNSSESPQTELLN